ncbi:hypothetical protein K504DRAFT_462928 [Pleomassaria siparia CBS 279.74]|uniref:Uncharacterized protein n=1 Tax=Pleomassaria siparia CBS 279.74 TaxID=1314801 RepID=A0A6G1JTN5_9PLEO|nr:hypothetical protein K504DRAFT_462928 [Pleomassaria siparia CBS 279.74]
MIRTSSRILARRSQAVQKATVCERAHRSPKSDEVNNNEAMVVQAVRSINAIPDFSTMIYSTTGDISTFVPGNTYTTMLTTTTTIVESTASSSTKTIEANHQPWPFTLPSPFRPAAGTTYYEKYRNVHDKVVVPATFIQRVLYGNIDPDSRATSPAWQLQPGNVLYSILHGVQDPEDTGENATTEATNVQALTREHAKPTETLITKEGDGLESCPRGE